MSFISHQVPKLIFFSGEGEGGGWLFDGGYLLQILSLRRVANLKRGAYLKLGTNSSIYSILISFFENPMKHLKRENSV